MMKGVIFFQTSLLVLCASLTGCSSGDKGNLPPPTPPQSERENPADPMAGRFAPGDILELFVKEDATLNGSYSVREGGYIVIPRAGRISVVGLDRDGAETAIRNYLQRTQLTEATVLVERTPSRVATAAAVGGPPGVPKIMVYITGNVPRSGVHYVPVPAGHTMGVYETLLITGGMSRFAKDQQVEIHRLDGSGTRQRAVVDLRPIRDGKKPDTPVGDGDIIHVPEKVFGF
jgi:protein involved in polysaccharide export with SLBB domain